jgi:hypothetical protein
MSSVDGTDEMGELNRRRKILEAPIAERVLHVMDLWKRQEDEHTPEELEANIRAELFVVGATVVADVLSALVRAADALESLAKDARAGAGTADLFDGKR